jgi:hypothetical protein
LTFLRPSSFVRCRFYLIAFSSSDIVSISIVPRSANETGRNERTGTHKKQQQQQRQRKIKKLYLAVTTEPVPLGMHVHWMWGSLSARGQMGGTPCQFVSHTPPATRKKAKVSKMGVVGEHVY